MAKIVITIEGDSQEIGSIQEVLQRLAGLAAGESEVLHAVGERESWTFEEFRQFWSRLQEGARQILAEIAVRPEGYSMVELERALGVPARVIGGRLSSVGHAMRRFPHKEDPVEFRTGGDETPGRRIYFMKPEVARIIRQLTSQAGAEEAANS